MQLPEKGDVDKKTDDATKDSPKSSSPTSRLAQISGPRRRSCGSVFYASVKL